MKTRTWILILSAMLAACLGLSIFLLQPRKAASYAEITSQGSVVKTVDLRTDQQFTVTTPQGGSNVITVREGKIAVTDANCPDHYCMDRGLCGGGAQIVCLPNRLVIRFLGEQEIDAVAG